MFTTFFQMTALPFTEYLNPEDLMQEERIAQSLAKLKFFADYGTIGLVTGEDGIGKTSLLKLFIHSLDKTAFYPIYVQLTNMKTIAFLNLLVTSLGETPKRGKDNSFLNILNKCQKTGRTCLLIIDEAQFLHTDSLIDLRLLLSSATTNGGFLKLILVGHPDIHFKLKAGCHNALCQRITTHHKIPSLSQLQTISYLDFHMKRVGSSDKIFDHEVKLAIHDHSKGIPRNINNIATASLLQAESLNSKKVSLDILNQAISDMLLYL